MGVSCRHSAAIPRPTGQTHELRRPLMYIGERFNGYSHLFGLLLATAGSAALLAKTVPTADPAKTASALVFGISMITLYAASTLFHSTRGRTKLFWQRVDH